jgi:VWFA-related protein
MDVIQEDSFPEASLNRFFATLAALLITTSLMAQVRLQPPQEPEMPRLVENIDVRVIDVDVIVTDRRGNFIPGLTKEDFVILENGVEKVITNFYEVEGNRARNIVADELGSRIEARPTTEIPEEMKRRIIFYIDNLSLAPFNRNRVFAQMKEFLATAMRPGDEAMVATYNRSMKVRVPFTRDRGQIESILDTIASESAMGVANRSERRSFEERINEARSYQEAISAARSYAASVEHDLRQSVASINALMSTLAGVEGKKVLVLTSEGFPMQPGRELFYLIDEVGKEKGWSSVGGTMLEGMSYDGNSLIQSVAKAANANGITLYTVHAAGMTGGSEISAENPRATPHMVSWAAAANTTESMQLMAEMTGGLASIQTNNFAEAFRRIQRDLDSYYSIGYRAGTERVDRQRYLQVRTKNRDYRVRARQTFVEKSTYAEMSDKAVANLLYRTRSNDLGIVARVGSPRPTDHGHFRVSIDIQIPMDRLTLMPQGESDHAGGFDVYVVVANKHNDLSDVARKAHQVRVPAADIKNVSGKYYTYTLDLLIERGLNRISLGVVDQISNVSGFTLEQINAIDMR